MEKGWNAKGLLAPLWTRVGGRDRLAEITGIQPGTLSGYNSGRLPLGSGNAAKVAAALGVSVLELGAPEAEADARGRILLDRLQELEGDVKRLTALTTRLARRVAALERRDQPGSERGEAAR